MKPVGGCQMPTLERHSMPWAALLSVKFTSLDFYCVVAVLTWRELQIFVKSNRMVMCRGIGLQYQARYFFPFQAVLGLAQMSGMWAPCNTWHSHCCMK